MMMIAFITFKSSLVPLFEGLWSSNSWEFEVSGFRRNRTDDLGIDSPSLWPTEPRLHVRSLHTLIQIHIFSPISINICAFQKRIKERIGIHIPIQTYYYMSFYIHESQRERVMLTGQQHGPSANTYVSSDILVHTHKLSPISLYTCMHCTKIQGGHMCPNIPWYIII